MRKFQIIIILFVVGLISCKNNSNTASTTSDQNKSATLVTPEKEGDGDLVEGDVASLIIGMHAGKGIYEFNKSEEADRVITKVELVRKDDKTVTVVSPEGLFPEFDIVELVDQFTAVSGRPAEGQGALMYQKSQKEIKVIIKQFADKGTVLRFGN